MEVKALSSHALIHSADKKRWGVSRVSAKNRWGVPVQVFHIRMKLSLSVHGAVLTPCAWWRSRHLQVVSDVAKAKTATIELHTVIEENALRVEVIDFACSQDLNLHGVCVTKQSQLMACYTQSFNWIHDLTCLNFLVFGILLSRKEILHQLRTNCNR